MFFRQAEVYDVHFLEVLAEHEVRGFYVAVDEPPIMHFFDSFKHFDQKLNGDF